MTSAHRRNVSIGTRSKSDNNLIAKIPTTEEEPANIAARRSSQLDELSEPQRNEEALQSISNSLTNTTSTEQNFSSESFNSEEMNSTQ